MKKSFKNITFIFLFILVLCLNVFAAPSPETTGFAVEIYSVTDKDGNVINVILKKADETMTADALNSIISVMGDAYSEDMVIVEVQDVIVPEGTVFPVTITFKVPGVTAETKGCFMHWNGKSWEKIDAIFGDGTMTGTFNSLSPVAFVMNVDVTQIKVGTSPQTSDDLTAIYTILAVSAAASLVLTKKRLNKVQD